MGHTYLSDPLLRRLFPMREALRQAPIVVPLKQSDETQQISMLYTREHSLLRTTDAKLNDVTHDKVVEAVTGRQLAATCQRPKRRTRSSPWIKMHEGCLSPSANVENTATLLCPAWSITPMAIKPRKPPPPGSLWDVTCDWLQD